MRRNGWIASVLFATLCLGGMATLVSQADYAIPTAAPAGERRWTMDPAPNPTRALEDIVPLGLSTGAEVQTSPATEPGKGSGRVLRLR
jgi:hypothetical protein